jgi:hypothetical protein
VITDKQLEDFRQFNDAGGTSEAANLTQSKSLKSQASSTAALFDAATSEGADYEADGVDILTNKIDALTGELNQAVSALSANISYLELATNPTDMQQVSQGVQVKNKLNSVSEETLAPSFAPIVSKSELSELDTAIASVATKSSSISSLMDEINAVLVVTPSEPPAPPVMPDPLPPELIAQAASLASELEPLLGQVQQKAVVIQTMTANAITERTEAVALFNQAVSFVVCDGQMQSGITADAVGEIYPRG